MLPTFLIPGAPKAGSSTLYQFLSAHPQILMSDKKEPDFFCGNWGLGLPFYEGCFADYRGETAIGEATVAYMADPVAPGRIHQVLPDVKLIFALREPVSRAVSHYWWRVNTNVETRVLDEVLASDDNYPVEYGLYHTQIRRFLDFFPMARMHFVFTDDMARDLDSVITSATEFLGVDTGANAGASPSNQARAPRSRTAATLLSRASASPLKHLATRRVRSLASKTVGTLAQANTKAFRPPPLRPDQRRLLQDTFAPEIEGLERLLGRDLTAWKEGV